MFEQIINYYKEVFSDPSGWYIFGQALGIFLMFFNFFIYVQKKRENILKLKLLTDILSVPQYLLIGATTAAILCGIVIPRDIVFYYKGRKKWATSIVWLFVFCILILISPILSWNSAGVIGIFPAVGSVLAVIGLYCNKPYLVRIFMLCAAFLYLIYGLAVPIIGTAIGNIINIVSIIIGLINDCKNAKSNKALSN